MKTKKSEEINDDNVKKTELETTSNSKSKNNSGILIIFILLFVITAVVGSVFWIEKNNFEQKYKTELKNYKNTVAINDSLEHLLANMEVRFEDLRMDQSSLSGVVMDLEDRNFNLENEKVELQNTIKQLKQKLFNISPEGLKLLNEEIKKLNEKSRAYEEKIAQLLKENKSLALNKGSSGDTTGSNESEFSGSEVETLKMENSILTSIVKKASVPHFGRIDVQTGVEKKGEFDETDKAKKTKIVRMSFDLIENSIVNEKLNLIAYLKIHAPDGSILTKEKEVVRLTDKSEIFTIKYPFSYNGKAKNIEIDFVNPFPYQKGNYLVELYFDDKVKQSKEFVLN